MRKLAGAMPKAHVARRVATAFVAFYHGQSIYPVLLGTKTHLEHLNKRNTEIQIRQVSADKTQTEHETDRHDGATGCYGLAAFSTVMNSTWAHTCMFAESWEHYAASRVYR